MTTTAIATGSSNNCLLHCFAHVLFDLPADKYEAVVKTTGYQSLLQHFGEYYGVETPARDDIDALNTDYATPLERELIWGPVLRQLLIAKLEEKADKTDSEELEIANLRKGNTAIRDSDFVKVLRDFDVNLVVENSFDNIEKAKTYPEYDVTEPSFVFNVIHRAAGGGHYDFYFVDDPSDVKAKSHNLSFQFKKDDSGLLDYSGTHFSDIVNTEGENEREILLKNLIQEHKALNSLAKIELGTQENMLGFSFEIEEFEADSLNSELDDDDEIDEIDVTKLNIRAKSNNDNEESKIELDPITGFPLEFVQKLDMMFPETDNWELRKEKGTIRVEGNDQFIKVKQEDFGVSFSGSSNSFGNMIQAANAYSQSLKEETEVEFELEATSEEQAIAFLKEMEGKVDMKLVTSVRIKGVELDDVGMKNLQLKISPSIEQDETASVTKKRSLSRGI